MRPVRPDRLRDVVDAVLEALDEGLDGPALAAGTGADVGIHSLESDIARSARMNSRPAGLSVYAIRPDKSKRLVSDAIALATDGAG